MILDTFDTVYVWVGHGANKKEKEEALRVATVSPLMLQQVWRCGPLTVPFPCLPTVQEYVRSDPSGRDEDNTLLIQIKQGFELPTFTSHFFGWNPQLWASSKTYEQYLEELKSSGGGQAKKVAEVWPAEGGGVCGGVSNRMALVSCRWWPKLVCSSCTPTRSWWRSVLLM